ncbi:HlyC/CorC family transporter [Tepidibacter hydrothermalis]|uniref:CNNM domain-containing protein n=1 Tax=Tepidibacter hydrothermalis TaxID=3036126 RepID=A0ABY8EEH6_9FIRM|nr:CNNM domain-containing protein [Tepidibacter hydrothermalis]WFD11347.1 CNNM domain-containing protein [Tepidibacter hydrothermalis]
MDPSSSWQFFILFILLGVSSFFSASETALMSLSKIKIRHMKEENVKDADVVSKLIENPNKLLGAILVGNNVVNIGASAIATSLFIGLFKENGAAIATAFMTILVLIFGEITPKSLAAQNSETVSLKVSKIISIVVVVLSPIVFIFNYVSKFIIKLFGGNPDAHQPFITEEELRTMVDVSHEEGVLEVEEKEMIQNVFEFGDLQAKDAMIQRTDVIGIDVEDTYEELVETFQDGHFSRMPIYEESIDDIIGILNVKDLAFVDKDKDTFDIRKYMRDPYYTFEFKKITELFQEMREEKVHMAIVLDEYGGTAGIITIEDLIEEIVGDIEDEYDEEDDEIKIINEDEYIIDGSTRINIVNETIGTNIESEEFESIGGVLIGELGRLPEEGESVEFDNIKFVVESLDKNRIKSIRLFTK